MGEVHDIFKLHSHISNHDVEVEVDKMRKLAEEESTWVEDLEKERQLYKKRMDGVVAKHHYPSQVPEAQIGAFSLQGDLFESKHAYMRQWNENNKICRVKKKELLVKYNNSAKRYTGSQMDELVEGDLSELMFVLDTLQDHINFLEGMSKSMTNLIFNMKYFMGFDDATRR